MYQNILVPTDGSPAARSSVEEAIRIAQSVGGRIRLIHVIDNSPHAPVAGLRQKGESILDEATATTRAAHVESESRLIEARGELVGECTVAESRSWPAELIVCGSHSGPGIRHHREYITRYSSIPVLLVRPASETTDP